MWRTKGEKRQRERTESDAEGNQKGDSSPKTETTATSDWAAVWQGMFPRAREEQNQKRVTVVGDDEWEISIPKKRCSNEMKHARWDEKNKEN